MASVDDIDELIATRKLNGVNDNLYIDGNDMNVGSIENLKILLFQDNLTQYGKRKLIEYYENEIQRQKEIIEDYKRMYCRAINENIPKQKIKDKIEELKNENYQIALDSEVVFDTGIIKNNIKIQVLEELLQKSEDK